MMDDETTDFPSFVQVKVECVYEEGSDSECVEQVDITPVLNENDTSNNEHSEKAEMVSVEVPPLGPKNKTKKKGIRKNDAKSKKKSKKESDSDTDVENLNKFTIEMIVFSSDDDRNEPTKESARSRRNKTRNKRKLRGTSRKGDDDNEKGNKSKKKNDNSTKSSKKFRKPQPKTLQCGHCEKQFSNVAFMKRHLAMHNVQFSVKCIMCSNLFTDLQTLLDDILRHNKEREFICQSCGRKYCRSESLKRHEGKCANTPIKSPKDLICAICAKHCRSKSKLQYHMMCHTDERPFPCSHCSKRFRCKARVDEHERTHLGLKPHVCSFCNKTFTTSSDMKKHERRHERPGFKTYGTREINPNKLKYCSVCDKKVTNFKTHMYLHCEGGTDTCKFCGKVLKSQSMYSHLKIHLEGMPYECDVCKRTFNRRHNMLSHRVRHTKDGYKPNYRIKKRESSESS